MNNDNFDALWDRLKQSVRERREPQAVYTMGGIHDEDHARIDTGDVDLDDKDQEMSSLHLGGRKVSFMAYARRDDLINIAEHCLLRAAQFDSEK